MKKIFISSAAEGLTKERPAIIQALKRLEDTVVIAMEDFPAYPEINKDYCIEQVQNSQAMVLILGFSYGSIDKEEKISLTEIEYNTAKSRNIPVFAILKLNEEGKWKPDNKDTLKDELLETFKKRLDVDLGRRKFSDTQQLVEEILISIHNYEVRHGEIGAKIVPIIEGKEFFKSYLNSQRILHHLHPFVGREQTIVQLDEFIKSEKQIAILYGQPTIGKSKILFEYCKKFKESFPKWKMLFVRETSNLTEESFKKIPIRNNILIVVDDAHSRTDLNLLLELARNYQDTVKLLFVTRSYAIKSLNEQILSNNFESSDVELLPEIKELEIENLKILGRNILGLENEAYLEPLLTITRNSTLFFVLGAKFLVDKSISPLMLHQDKEFRLYLSMKFKNIILGDINQKYPIEQIQEILKIVAILSPIPSDNRDFQEKVASVLEIKRHQVIDLLSSLEESGILIRRGYSLIITPDILSDFILDQACISPQGKTTEYADKIVEIFSESSYFQNILTNLTKLEYRIAADGHTSGLLDNIWKKKREAFIASSNLERTAFLGFVEKIAYFLPDKSLDLVEFALKNPSNNNIGILSSCTHDTVKQNIPKILERISYNFEYLPRCADLLWELGKDQEGQLLSNPNHPIRILSKIVDYDLDKPVEYRKVMLDHIEKWLTEPDAFEHLYSPLDVLDPIFNKEGDVATRKGKAISISGYHVVYAAVEVERKRALNVISKLTQSDSLKITMRAIKTLFSALNPPYGSKEAQNFEDIYAQFIPEQLAILEIIRGIVTTTNNPVVLVEISSGLQHFIWQQHSIDIEKEVVKQAELILQGIPDSFEIRVVRALCNRYDRHWTIDYDEEIQKNEQSIRNVAQEFFTQFSDVDLLLMQLEDYFSELEQAQKQPDPSRFFHYLASQDSKISLQITMKIFDNPSYKISNYINAFITIIRKNDVKTGIKLISTAIKIHDLNLSQQISYGYSCNWWGSIIQMDDLEQINKLINFVDLRTKSNAIKSLEYSPIDLKDQTITILKNIELDKKSYLSDSFCEALTQNKQIKLSTLTESQIREFLLKLIPITNFRTNAHGAGYSTRRFIRECGDRIPEDVITFVLKRIEMKVSLFADDINYEPFPFDGLHEEYSGIIKSQNYQNYLRRVRDYTIDHNSYQYKFWISHFFADLSDNYSDPCLNVLSEWIDAIDSEKIINVSILLNHAPVDLLFTKHEFISKIIETAYQKDANCYKKTLSNLNKISYSKGRSGIVGEPFPLDIKIRDRSIEIAQKFPKDSPTEKFYRELSQSAKRDIEYQLKMEEELEL